MANASAQLHAIAARMKGTDLKVPMMRALRAAAATAIPAFHAAALEQLPHTGGLNKQVAGQKITPSVRTGVRTAGVRLVTRAPDTAQTDSGYVRHPVFGRRGKGDWKTEQIPRAAGWWTNTAEAQAPGVTALLRAELEAAAVAIQRAGL